MATRGRPRSPGGPTRAADRKREFDRRMRNADGQVEGEPARTPVVLYLSAEAREVMRRHREDIAIAGAPPLHDSKLVEALLLAFQSHRSDGSPSPIDSAATSVNDLTVPPATDDEVQRLRLLRAKICRLKATLEEAEAARDKAEAEIDDPESISAERWSAVRRKLVDRHYSEASLLMHPLAQRLHQELNALTSDAARMRAVNEELIEYLITLLDALERPS